MHLERVNEAYLEADAILAKYLGPTHPVRLELAKVRKRCHIQDELEQA
jgi:hypothetical protein